MRLSENLPTSSPLAAARPARRRIGPRRAALTTGRPLQISTTVGAWDSTKRAAPPAAKKEEQAAKKAKKAKLREPDVDCQICESHSPPPRPTPH